jgi:DNA-binding transcriptional ArsR family regulator
MFPRLSLSELSSFLGRSKATVSHHLSKLESIGIIVTTSKQARGSIDAKVYELTPKFFDLSSLDFSDLKSYKENSFELVKVAIQRDKLLFEVFKNIFEQLKLIYDGFEEVLLKSKSETDEKFQNLDFGNLIKYNIWFLTEEQRDKFNELFSDFKTKLMEFINDTNKVEKEKAKPYLLFHSLLPFKKINEHDSEKKSYKKFFKALD